ncbi:hypothetical protein CAPTEDRAFT_156898 [Capitella teleta]|uniref:Non-specific serine/threonine protein kinase n=1 Tax=Capitella teleta TaxID=283909 RepID=R7V228_CAPTE|nr:hypothetical protein CAPTEDRAFT_156898 [Capitella teleta]|eukprot:ELU12542.1 hypothetical protein CAPTEDRAFT_156898 [Capitella teleta]
MTEELEGLKMTGMPSSEKTWKNRRSQRLDKMQLLDLQSSLQSEIQAKETIREELRNAKALQIVTENKLKEALAMTEEQAVEIARLHDEVSSAKVTVFDRPDSQSSFYRFLFNDASRIEDVRIFDLGTTSHGKPPAQSILHSSPQYLTQIETSEHRIASTLPIRSSTMTPRKHHFNVRSFSTPIKCHHCTSLMIGLQRQGNVCEECDYSCHVACADKAPQVCPVPPDQIKRPIGIDPTKGVGTAYEGYVRIPRHGGIRKGWVRQFVVVCDFKLFLYDINPDRNNQATSVVNQVIDMRDEGFAVSSVSESDVIHANKKDITCIFKVMTSLISPPEVSHQVLMLADNEQDKRRWVGALSELHKVLRKNSIPDKSVFRVREVYDSQLALLVKTNAAAILDRDHLVLGTEDGLYAIDLQRDSIMRIGDRKTVYQVEILPDEHLFIFTITGKQRHIRLMPLAALENDKVECVKIEESRSCSVFCTGTVRQGTSTCLCVASKRTIVVYELNRTKVRHRKVKEIQCAGQVQYLSMVNEKLFVGFPSSFAIYSVQGDSMPIALVNSEDPTLQFILQSPVDALLVAELASQVEYLLVFNSLGVYVDYNGQRTRSVELMWPASPHSASYQRPYLTIYSEGVAFVYHVESGEWLQTLSLKNTRPLCSNGSLGLVQALDSPSLIYLRDITDDEDAIHIPDLVKDRNLLRGKRRFSFRSVQDVHAAKVRAERKSRIISAPTNFSHVAHMGPDQGMQVLIDLPAAAAAAAVQQPVPSGSRSAPAPEEEKLERVRSMFSPNFAPGTQRGIDIVRHPPTSPGGVSTTSSGGSSSQVNGYNGNLSGQPGPGPEPTTPEHRQPHSAPVRSLQH